MPDHPKGEGSSGSMETVGWVAIALVIITGAGALIAATLDQIIMLCRKLVKAIGAAREVRDEVRRFKAMGTNSTRQTDDDDAAAGAG